MPDVLSAFEFWLLIGMSGFTSFLTAAIGLGGGTLMLALLAHVLPAKAIIPIHGVVQLGSNVGRSVLLWKYIDRTSIVWFVLGGCVGAMLGGYIVWSLPANLLRLTIAVFILYSVWGPKVNQTSVSRLALLVSGSVTTLLTMFVGATGPFVMTMFRLLPLQPKELVATVATAMSFQHFIKVFVFGVLGFSFYPYLPLLSLMIVTGFFGTLLGKRVLIKADQTVFSNALDVTMTALALSLIYVSFTAITA